MVVYQYLAIVPEPISGHEARHVYGVNDYWSNLDICYVAVSLNKSGVLLYRLVQLVDVQLKVSPALPRIVSSI